MSDGEYINPIHPGWGKKKILITKEKFNSITMKKEPAELKVLWSKGRYHGKVIEIPRFDWSTEDGILLWDYDIECMNDLLLSSVCSRIDSEEERAAPASDGPADHA